MSESDTKSPREYQRDTLRAKSNDELLDAYETYLANYKTAFSDDKKTWLLAVMDCWAIIIERQLMDEVKRRVYKTTA